MLFTVGVVLTIAAIAVPAFMEGLEALRTRSAARYLAGRLRLARASAVARSTMVGLRFEPVGEDYQYAAYEDGDRDGIRTADIHSGTDPEIVPLERLAFRFKGVRFGFLEGVPLVDGEATESSGDPVHAGLSNIVTLSPHGSATAATLYICGPRRSQYAVRVLGVTGRTRVLEFDRASHTWLER